MLIIGSIMTIVGTMGGDLISVLSFVLSEENLKDGGENILVKEYGKARKYLDTCINGDGKLYNDFVMRNNKEIILAINIKI